MKNTTIAYGALMNMVTAKMSVKDVTVEVRPANRGAFMIHNKKRVIEAYYLARTNTFTFVMYEDTFKAIQKALPESIQHDHHDDWRMKDVLTITDTNFKDFQSKVLPALAKALDKKLTTVEKPATDAPKTTASKAKKGESKKAQKKAAELKTA